MKSFPIIVLDTGGVRLQEANYGLLSISEIGNMIIALKEYVPVIGLVPLARVGSLANVNHFCTNELLDCNEKARVGLNGPGSY